MSCTCIYMYMHLMKYLTCTCSSSKNTTYLGILYFNFSAETDKTIIYAVTNRCTCMYILYILCCHGNDRSYIFEYTPHQNSTAYNHGQLVHTYVSYTPAYVRKCICDKFLEPPALGKYHSSQAGVYLHIYVYNVYVHTLVYGLYTSSSGFFVNVRAYRIAQNFRGAQFSQIV